MKDLEQCLACGKFCTRVNLDFPGGPVVKNPPASEGDTGSTPAQEDPMCSGETKPASHNYWAHCAAVTGAHTPWGLHCWARWLRVKNLPANAGDAGLIPGSGRSTGGGNGTHSSISCLEKSVDRRSWQTTVHRVGKELYMTEQLGTHFHML